MLGTYIKNRGITKTIIHSNNKNNTNEIKWDADYDGNLANVSINSNTNGKHDKVHFTLNNQDLANMLNIDTVNIPLEQRLKRDFKKNSRQTPKIYQIEFGDAPTQPLVPMTPQYQQLPKSLFIEEENNYPVIEEEFTPSSSIEEPQNISIEQLLSPVNTHLSSPKSNEEFIIPMTIDKKTLDKFTLTPHKRHRKYKTHKTHKVYKRRKSTASKNRSKSKKSTKRSFSLF